MSASYLSPFRCCRWLLAVPAMFSPSVFAADVVHVSPQGKDTNAGTAESPLATPGAARDMVRQMVSKGLAEPVEVIFSAGTYTLGSTLELRPEDSGTRDFPVTWKAAPGAKVVWTGGARNSCKVEQR